MLRGESGKALNVFTNRLNDFARGRFARKRPQGIQKPPFAILFPIFVFRFAEPVGIKHERIARTQ
jgi:hypothetical protein